MSTPYLALQVIMMPRDANPMPSVTPEFPNSPLYRTIFGGVLLSYIDQAGAIGAIHEVVQAGGPIPAIVTVAINRVEFKQPVLVGDVVRFLTRLAKMGRTSVTIHVNVEARRGGKVYQVTEAELVYVGIDVSSPDRKPKPLLPGG